MVHPAPPGAARRLAVKYERFRGRWFALALLFFMAPVPAYETDPWLDRERPLADAGAELDAQVNIALARIVAERPAPASEREVVERVYRHLGGRSWADRIERHAMRSPTIERLVVDAHASTYAGMPFWITRVTAFSGVAPTIAIGGVHVGTDKLGHFISQGRKFWLRWARHGDEARAARRGVTTERGIFGRLASGVYSNADLVANYEGYRFHRSLFEPGVVGDKPAILRREDDHWVLQRSFTFVDHVNPYWDEALNPSAYGLDLERRLAARLLVHCVDVRASPAAWSIDAADDHAFARAYAHLGMRDNHNLRLPALCAEPSAGAALRPAVARHH